MFVNPFLFFLTLILSVLNALLPHLTTKYISPFILKRINRFTPKEQQLLAEKHQLKQDQSKLNMVNDFAKYSKIQRKINVIDEQLSELKSGSGSRNMVIKMGFPYLSKFLMGIVIVCFVIMYRNSPVMVLTDWIDLNPFGKIISYPNNEINAVSVHFWVMCCSSIVKLIQFKI